jgi:hypothetical protein
MRKCITFKNRAFYGPRAASYQKMPKKCSYNSILGGCTPSIEIGLEHTPFVVLVHFFLI